jgi:hypothetical protein
VYIEGFALLLCKRSGPVLMMVGVCLAVASANRDCYWLVLNRTCPAHLFGL